MEKPDSCLYKAYILPRKTDNKIKNKKKGRRKKERKPQISVSAWMKIK